MWQKGGNSRSWVGKRREKKVQNYKGQRIGDNVYYEKSEKKCK